MNISTEVGKMKSVAPLMAASDIELRNKALSYIIEKLKSSKEEIFKANHQDLEAAENAGISQAVIKRLKFDEGKLSGCLDGIRMLMELSDPVGVRQMHRQLDEGLVLTRVTCPIGVIGVIFEARPDALVQISSLCIKSGNCAVLKGGKETAATNKVLFGLIRDAAIEAGLPEGVLLQAESHADIDELLKCNKYVDLLIPRGSNAFVKHIMDNTQIPVMGHADGICHIYIDKDCDFDKAIKIIVDAKTQYTAACNAVETLLVNREVAKDFLPLLYDELKKNGVKLNGTAEVSAIIDVDTIDEEDFVEYLDLEASVGLVNDVSEAIKHINKFGSHHTDCIITEDDEAAKVFMQMVDSAGVYRNCSTRFADGFRYGFGAEVGISTGKIHARGPVGLEGLVTYKYLLEGSGQIVDDYVTGKKTFHFKDMQ